MQAKTKPAKTPFLRIFSGFVSPTVGCQSSVGTNAIETGASKRMRATMTPHRA